MKGFRLPNGEVLKGKKNEQRFVDAWKEFAEPIEKATGIKAYGYDPGILFRSKERQETLDLPNWFIERINNALTKSENYVEQSRKKVDPFDGYEKMGEYWFKKEEKDGQDNG